MLVLFGLSLAMKLVLVIMPVVITRMVMVLIGLVGLGCLEKSPTKQKKLHNTMCERVFWVSISHSCVGEIEGS